MLRELWELRRILFNWITANILGVAAVGGLVLALPFLKSIPGLLTSSLIIGLPIGFAQWFVLRRIAPVSIFWIISISAGLLIFLAASRAAPVGTLAFLEGESTRSLTAAYTIVGLLIGLIQWPLLRRKLSTSLAWIVGSTVGLGLGTGLVLASDLINRSGLLSLILVVIVYSLATGFVSSWLSFKTRKSQSNFVKAA